MNNDNDTWKYKIFAINVISTMIRRWKESRVTARDAAEVLDSHFVSHLFALLDIEQEEALVALGII